MYDLSHAMTGLKRLPDAGHDSDLRPMHALTGPKDSGCSVTLPPCRTRPEKVRPELRPHAWQRRAGTGLGWPGALHTDQLTVVFPSI